MPHGYKLVSKIKSADPEFIPSLIAVHKSHTTPSPDDKHFESVELTGYRAGCVETIERTNMVAYDSLELGERDPVLKVYTSGVDFYITLSEAYTIAKEEGDDLFSLMLDTISGAKRTAA